VGHAVASWRVEASTCLCHLQRPIPRALRFPITVEAVWVTFSFSCVALLSVSTSLLLVFAPSFTPSCSPTWALFHNWLRNMPLVAGLYGTFLLGSCRPVPLGGDSTKFKGSFHSFPCLRSVFTCSAGLLYQKMTGRLVLQFFFLSLPTPWF